MSRFITEIQSRLFGSRYSLIRRLGGGTYGDVYLGRDIETGCEVALKLEHRIVSRDFFEDQTPIDDEVSVYTTLQGIPGFAKMLWRGELDEYKCLALELLGPNLDDLHAFCGHRFSLKTTLMIADQLLTRYESLHKNGIVHRDVKPSNCMIGVGVNENVVHVADFAMVGGTARYMSIRAHTMGDTKQEDDLESLAYMLVYLLKGHLPWQGHGDLTDRMEVILQHKKATTAQEICKDIPVEFANLVEYGRAGELRGELPDYPRLKTMFRDLARREGIEYDNVFDWTIRAYLMAVGKLEGTGKSG